MAAVRDSGLQSRQSSGGSRLRELLAAKEREFKELTQSSFEALEREV
jgi:hypothetical protein